MFSSRASSIAAALLALLAFAPGARAATPPSFPAAGELLRPTFAVQAEPSRRAPRVAVLKQFRLDFHPRIALAVAKRRVDGTLSYRVELPARPAPQRGWV